MVFISFVILGVRDATQWLSFQLYTHSVSSIPYSYVNTFTLIMPLHLSYCIISIHHMHWPRIFIISSLSSLLPPHPAYTRRRYSSVNPSIHHYPNVCTTPALARRRQAIDHVSTSAAWRQYRLLADNPFRRRPRRGVVIDVSPVSGGNVGAPRGLESPGACISHPQTTRVTLAQVSHVTDHMTGSAGMPMRMVQSPGRVTVRGCNWCRGVWFVILSIYCLLSQYSS